LHTGCWEEGCIREEQGRTEDFVQQIRDENWYIDFRQDDSLKQFMNTRTQMTDLFHAVRPLYSSQPLEKVVAVGVLPKDRAVLDATANDMVQGTRGIDAGSAGHS
jgi:hypothetical protein